MPGNFCLDTNIVNFMLLGAGLKKKKKTSLNNLELCSEVQILENSFIPLDVALFFIIRWVWGNAQFYVPLVKQDLPEYSM